MCFLWAHNVALGVITVALNVFSEELRPINTHILPKPSSMTPSASGVAAFVENDCDIQFFLFVFFVVIYHDKYIFIIVL